MTFDCTPPPGVASASLASALRLASASTATLDGQPLHPALAALHALLLPPLLYPSAFAHLCIDTPRGLLLSGPPGVGKTYSVAQVCRQLHVELFLLDGATIFGGGAVAGAAEEMLRTKFREAQACTKPAVLFIDEIVRCALRTESSTSA
jgi:transitional endoplasmic reticulum ATPase